MPGPFSGTCAIWAIKSGEFIPTNFSGDAAGLAAAVAHCGSNGTITMFPGNSTIPVPTLPAGVEVFVHEAGRITHYGQAIMRNRLGSLTGWLDVHAFGALGDGTTDDTAAINAAHAALPANGGTLFFPPGRYLISSTLTFTKVVTIQGCGFENDFTASHACSIVKKSTVTGYAVVLSERCSVMRDITIEGQTGNSGSGVQIFNNSCGLERVTVLQMGLHGIVVGGPGVVRNVNHWFLYNCHSRNNGGDGIFIESSDGAGGPNANGGVCVNVATFQNVGKGTHVKLGGKNTFTGCVDEANTGEGVFLEGNSDSNVWVGGDREGNNPGPNVQIRIGATGTTNDNCFFYPGILGTASSFVDDQSAGSRTLIFDTALTPRYRIAGGAGGELFSNGPQGGTSSANGSWYSLYNDGVERLRLGSGVNAPQTGQNPAQFYSQTDNVTWLTSRDVSTGRIRLAAGPGLASYVLLDPDASGVNPRLETNQSINVTTGKVYKVAGTQVLGAQGAAVADATGGATVDAQARTAINTLLARLRAHGVIAP